MSPLTPASNYPLDCGSPTATFARQFAKRSRSERGFDIVAQQSLRPTSTGTESVVEVNDRVLNRLAGATSVSDYVVQAETAQGTSLSDTFSATYAATVEPSGIFSVSPEGNSTSRFIASHVSNGVAVVRVQSRSGETQSLRLSAVTGDGAVDRFAEWKAGSLARHIWDGTFARLNDRPPITPQIVPQNFGILGNVQYEYRSAPFLNIYSQWPGNTHVIGNGLVAGHQDPAGPWVRNPDFWLADVDLTCVSAWNVGTNGVVRATAISPEHWVSCQHGWQPKVGDTLYFVGRSAGAGEPQPVSTHTVTAVTGVPGADLRVGRMTPALPEWISFAKVLPSDHRLHLPSGDNTAFLPVFRVNQDFQMNVHAWRPAGVRLHVLADLSPFTGEYSQYRQLTNDVRFLDSGNPTFCLISGEAVLLSTQTSYIAGPFLSDDGVVPPSSASPGGQRANFNYDLINAAMSTLGGGYQLTPIDLSAFPTYTGDAPTPLPVSLLLNFNGANNSTSFVDTSPNGFSVTANGDAKISTAQSKFGGASGFFPGVGGDYLETEKNALLDLSENGDLTLEAWIYLTALDATRGVVGSHLGSFDNHTNVYVYIDGRLAVGKIGENEIDTDEDVIAENTWHHIAIVRQEETTTIFVDGQIEASNSTEVWSSPPSNKSLRIGYMHPSNGECWGGYIDDLRVTRAALYTANFTPPTSELGLT
jgi:hypothetical protein